MNDRKEFWELELPLQKESGLSMRAYCLDKGLSYSSMIYWSRRLRTLEPMEKLVEIPGPSTAICFRLEVTLANRIFRLVLE